MSKTLLIALREYLLAEHRASGSAPHDQSFRQEETREALIRAIDAELEKLQPKGGFW